MDQQKLIEVKAGLVELYAEAVEEDAQSVQARISSVIEVIDEYIDYQQWLDELNKQQIASELEH
jgi:hypothetical protein